MYGGSENLKIPIEGQISKLSQTYRVTYQNKRERGTKTMEKELGQSDLPVWRKIQKTTRNATFLKKKIVFLGGFWDFSINW